MPAAIRRLTVSQFSALLRAAAPTLTRSIDAVHLHHTWRPTRSQFKGQATIEAMRNYHVNTNGWSDIAQHLSIDPQGLVWTGRNWNAPPASQAGRNGDKAKGPFMIEMIGDFDAGRDSLDGEQRSAVVAVVASLLHTFKLTAKAVHFHRELGSPKTCPGSGVDKTVLLEEIDAVLAQTPKVAAKAVASKPRGAVSQPPFASRHWLGSEVTQPVGEPESGFEHMEIPEHQYAADVIREEARSRAAADRGYGAREITAVLERSSRWEVLRPYVVNLTRGRLSQGGEFTMPDGSIEAIIDSIRQYAAATPNPRLMLHAHGGLVGEKDALKYAEGCHRWWLDHGIYPVYFIWETSFLEVLKQRLGLARGALGDARDRMFEATARAAGGKRIWSDMKESARLASSTDAGNGEAGGARIFAAALAALIKSSTGGPNIAVHAVGHSAGAVFHAHLLPLLVGMNVPVTSLAFLAPAVRIDLFKQMLLDPIAKKAIQSFALFTMDEEAERDDDCVEPLGVTLYGKSLLYLVSRAFETKRKTPILGLEEMLADDGAVQALFKNGARLELARARGKPQNDATRAKKHGCFDNDEATMASVLEMIAGAPPARPFPLTSSACSGSDVRSLRLPGVATAPAFIAASRADAIGAGARRALCVGIDAYRDNPLAGCVRDATTWARVLSELRFEVQTLLDAAASRQAVLEALAALIDTARPGEMLVFQYSGHGTQVEDLNGDEADRYDEALVPVDYHAGALLLDDDLADVYRRLPNDVVLTLFMDCCHSGTNSRFAPIGRSQSGDTVRRRFLELSPEQQEAHRRFRARYDSPAPTTAEESLPGVVHFAACLDNQYAYESEGQGHFTRIATAALARAVAGGVTNESYALDVAAKVGALGRPQTPRLMRLPAALEERPILTAATTGMPPLELRTDPAWDEWCLQFFESGAAHWRQRLGR